MAKSRKSSRSGDVENPEFKTVFVIQPGPYAGQKITMLVSHAEAGLADGWAIPMEEALAPNPTPLLATGEAPQSYLDWVDDFATPGEPDNPDPPEPPPVPTVTSLTPDTAVSGAPDDITMVVNGTGFTAASVITFNDLDEPTTLISDTQVSTGVKPSLFVVPAVCPVAVRDVSGTSNSVDFTFTEAEPVEDELSGRRRR